MSASTVHVKNISSATSEKEIKEFFSFCGKITSLEVTDAGATKDATVVFEKETAAKTALLLDQTKLGSTSVSVTHANASSSDDDHYTHNTERDFDEITQEEKPRTRILAEYIAQGYAIGDQGIQKAIDLDHKHGVSARFLQTLQNLDQKTKATDKAKSVDQSYQITEKANNVAQSLWSGLNTYYEKAVGTPTGQKLVNFYTQQQRQVIDIHNEARRLADLKKDNNKDVHQVTETGKTACKCGSDSSECPCAPGACSCLDCEKSDLKSVPGKPGKTQCGCKGKVNDCACEAGHCLCQSCPKATQEKVPGTDSTKCGCAGDDKNCACEAGKCACNNCSK